MEPWKLRVAVVAASASFPNAEIFEYHIEQFLHIDSSSDLSDLASGQTQLLRGQHQITAIHVADEQIEEADTGRHVSAMTSTSDEREGSAGVGYCSGGYS